MSLLQKAYETYQNLSHVKGVFDLRDGYRPLVPPYHLLKSIDIKVQVDINGNFVSACLLGKLAGNDKDFEGIIPVTDKSIATNNYLANPHPLSNKLFVLIGLDTKMNRTDEGYNNYMDLLEEWAKSRFSHQSIRAIFKYMESNRLYSDLISHLVIPEIPEDKKNSWYKKFGNAIVGWEVLGLPNNEKSCCFENQNLFNLFVDFITQKLQDEEQGLCYVTGEKTLLCKSHPMAVINLFGQAKLICASDQYEFGFRGRLFNKKEETYNVGDIVSLKAHNVISWIFNNHGKIILSHGSSDKTFSGRSIFGNLCFLCWNTHGKEIPMEHFDSKNSEALMFDDIGISQTEIVDVAEINKIYGLKFKKALVGFKDEFNVTDDIIMAVFTAMTPGRLSLVSYAELNALEYIQLLEDWYSTMAFFRLKFYDKKLVIKVFPPSIYDICLAMYGVEDNSGKLDIIDKSMKTISKVVGKTFETLNNCMIHKQPIPYYIVNRLAERASKLKLYSATSAVKGTPNPEFILSVACAVIKKYYNEVMKGEYLMTLQKDMNDRSYQFGRLLAVFDRAEQSMLKEKGRKRETNAMNMQSFYQQRPFYSMSLIHNMIKPYFKDMDPGLREWYKGQISEIMEKISAFPEKELDLPLKETYLLGYYLQRKDMYAKKNDDANASVNEANITVDVKSVED